MPKTTIEHEYRLEQKVFLVHDPEQHERMIIGFIRRLGTPLKYEVACGAEITESYEGEISPTRKVI